MTPSADEEPADVERLLGIATGCMGMSIDDFCRCTPSEFHAAYEAWNETQQQRERAEWERARIQCLCALQPYSKKQLSARDVMKFPWDEESTSEEALSREEVMERYRKARERAGLK